MRTSEDKLQREENQISFHTVIAFLKVIKWFKIMSYELLWQITKKLIQRLNRNIKVLEG
jgi:hypothetical protein